MFQAKNFFLTIMALWATGLSAHGAGPEKEIAAGQGNGRVSGLAPWQYVKQGWTMLNQGKAREAMQLANMALQKDPHDAWALILRGSAHSELEENAYAVQDLERGLALDPKMATSFVYSNCGKVYWKLRQYNKATAAATKAINLNPKLPFLYRDRAAMYMALNDDKKALTDLNVSIKLNPDERDGYVQRATIYRNNKQYQLAISDATKVVNISEKDKELDRYWSQALGVRADSYDGIGEKDLAKKDRAKVNAVGKDWIEDMMGK